MKIIIQEAGQNLRLKISISKIRIKIKCETTGLKLLINNMNIIMKILIEIEDIIE